MESGAALWSGARDRIGRVDSGMIKRKVSLAGVLFFFNDASCCVVACLHEASVLTGDRGRRGVGSGGACSPSHCPALLLFALAVGSTAMVSPESKS